MEDEMLTRLAAARHLRQCGYRVLEAASADEGLRVFRSGAAVDVLFTDVNLPGPLDGVALARWARANRPEVRTIITSGRERAVHLERGLGNDDIYLQKPYEPQILVRQIQGVLAGR